MYKDLKENWEYNVWPEVDLDGNIINSSRRKSLNEDYKNKTCPNCGTRLNDGGTCPICDDGEEDYFDELSEEEPVTKAGEYLKEALLSSKDLIALKGKKIKLSEDLYYCDIEDWYDTTIPEYFEQRGDDLIIPAGTVLECGGKGGNLWPILGPDDLEFAITEYIKAEIIDSDVTEDIPMKKCDKCGKILPANDPMAKCKCMKLVEDTDQPDATTKDPVEDENMADLKGQVRAALDSIAFTDDDKEEVDYHDLIDAVLAYFDNEDAVSYIKSILCADDDSTIDESKEPITTAGKYEPLTEAVTCDRCGEAADDVENGLCSRCYQEVHDKGLHI